MRPVRLLLVGLLALSAVPAFAQSLHTELYVSGLQRPVAFLQDPTQPHVQFVVEQRGRIRPIVNGQLSADDFLDLGGAVSSNREGGLLGMAFAPDYASSGRFFLNFTNEDNNTVIARFTRMPGDPMHGDPDSRFDLIWPDGAGVIAQPYCCHYGGHLAFGPDGYLYIGLGDGGAWDDPDHNAQNPRSLLGKMLRIDVSVADDDGRGYIVPDGNPFVGISGVLPEIWAAGLRNPWRYTFDDPARGGTGALIISDVGQNQVEEFDYEPAGRGGRNYGWRNREGGRDYVDTAPPWFEPLVDPTYEYAHGGGRAIIGGFVYRGSALDASFVGRYFFGDFVSGQLWSMGLLVDPDSGEAVAGDLIEHTDDATQDALNLFTSFGEDADGELYVTSWWHGSVHKILPGPPPPPPVSSDVLLALDAPSSGPVTQPLSIAGWSLDLLSRTDTGIDYVEVWATRQDGSAPVRLGRAAAVSRSDVAEVFGAQYELAGFMFTAPLLRAGTYAIDVYAHSAITKKFAATASVRVDVASTVKVAIDQPASGQISRHVMISGWALDGAATTSTGVDSVHVWAFPSNGGSPIWVGSPAYGSARGDVASVFGQQFTDVGFWMPVTSLPAGRYRLMIYAHSSIDGTFTGEGVDIAITPPAPDPQMAIDTPSSNATEPGAFSIAGWAVDLGSDAGTGVDAVHVWAFPAGNPGAPIFLGAADYGWARGDVGAVLGASFANSGYYLMTEALPRGEYQLGVYVHSTVANAFNQVKFVHVIVP